MTPAQQIAVSKLLLHAAQYALAVKYGEAWSETNEVIQVPDLEKILKNPKGFFRHSFEEQFLRLSEDLGRVFSRSELEALSQPEP